MESVEVTHTNFTNDLGQSEDKLEQNFGFTLSVNLHVHLKLGRNHKSFVVRFQKHGQQIKHARKIRATITSVIF